ncbi:UBA-like domain-containing protein 2 isoform X2 [Apis florea]|uniref:UBA-like domain-containing protein 2 isoform X2 n=1 Tax=Apis florea TaxID=7463 RepID=UPI0006295D8F|nr:UBA-like domain-containing protein 2 isoform X2 [Apis florea]
MIRFVKREQNSLCEKRLTALSIFFQEAAIPPCAQGPGTHFGQITPCNTPATPPNFPDALLAFSKMSAGDKTPSGMSPSQNGLHQNSMQIGMAPQHHGGRCSVTGSAQQQTQSQQLGLGEPQR